MPISYPAGTVAEHTAVRDAVGIFDVSHLGKLADHRAGGGGVREPVLHRRPRPDRPRARPVHAVLHADRRRRRRPHRLPDRPRRGARGAQRGQRGRGGQAAAGGRARGRHRDRPAPRPRRARRAGPALGRSCWRTWCRVPRTAWTTWPSRDAGTVRVCRTGYTGEHGYELLVPAADAPALWDALLAAAGPLGGGPAGLGARDTLRTEMGYPLHGQDLSVDITPVQAGSGWAVGWDKPEFWGRDALVAEKAAGPARRLRGLRATGRGVPRPAMTVLRDGEPVGATTSGTFSPTLRTGIALALLDTVGRCRARRRRHRGRTRAPAGVHASSGRRSSRRTCADLPVTGSPEVARRVYRHSHERAVRPDPTPRSDAGTAPRGDRRRTPASAGTSPTTW